VFLVLGATSVLGAAVQILQVGVPRALPSDLWRRAVQSWTLGSWSLGGSVVAALRFQVLVWLVALTSGRADVASLQAVITAVNIVNPIMTGVCNIVPQTVAKAAEGGAASAWKAARPYIALGLVPTAAYAGAAIAAPEVLLRVIYGHTSVYVADGIALRILALGMLISYGGEMVCSFLHGLGAPRLAWLMNAGSLGLVVCTFLMLQPSFGWYAAALASLVGQAARLMMCPSAIGRVMAMADGHGARSTVSGPAIQVTSSSRLS
jgi:O-antigen/teichoic acid export membrane protein